MGKRTFLLLFSAVVFWSIWEAMYGMSVLPMRITDSFKKLRLDTISISEFFSPKMSIAIIGSSGYIGSRLLHHLKKEKDWNAVGYDRIFSGQASYEISSSKLQKFHVVIYLGGLTGRVMCRERSNEVERENVADIYNLAKRMLSSQLLIFASTSAITEGSGAVAADEDYPASNNLLDLYALSLLRRENTLRNLSFTSNQVPQMIGLRFGTVVGLSESQRIDLAHMALICQAFLSGRIHVTHPESNRAFLCMEDLLRAIKILIIHSKSAKRFDLFHFQSFSGSNSNVANAVAARTKALIRILDHPVTEDSVGFSLNATKFQRTFNFTFKGSQDQVITRLIEDVPRMCLGRQSRLDNRSIPCMVCGSPVMHTILDLHTQPLANDFRNRTEESVRCERFPLRLVRCPICHHTQLSHVVDRVYLFSHYLYQSGTSQSLRTYFEWLADKIIDESGTKNGIVLELACNDGSQLNQFSKRGWKTVGIDAAKNLVEIARAHGHIVYTGFWGVDRFPLLPSPESVDVIIAQNVFAHVDNPVQFLNSCAAIMSVKTKLYIQTSQCEMYETGQFDTVYHEHLSFFTAHSFKKIADITGLKIINFEITPIHGRSCLVTFQRKTTSSGVLNTVFQREDAWSLSLSIQKERNLGITDAWFFHKYQAQAQTMRGWIVNQLATLHSQGHTIVAYGSAAEGMVLLHFLLESSDQSWNISYVVDDAPLKQNTFCPGTSIPVFPTSKLTKHNSNIPLTIVVFAWNFWEEISTKIRQLTVDKGVKTVFILLPFPTQLLSKLESKTNLILTKNILRPSPWPDMLSSGRRPLLLITHFFNEEVLLPFWIRHHAPMFDMAILIDYNSTDRSLDIIRGEAPSSWRIVPSQNKFFMSINIDLEVMYYEKMYPTAWKIALNIPEFLIHVNLNEMLSKLEASNGTMIVRFRSVIMIGNDSVPFKRYTHLLQQRTQYAQNPTAPGERFGVTLFSRFMHRCSHDIYKPGRHMITEQNWQWAPVGFIAKFQYTPWPEIMSRKLQISRRILPEEFARGWATYHNVNAEQLKGNKRFVDRLPRGDLRNFVGTTDILSDVHRLWREIIQKDQ